jgi:hypothetical protein
VTDYRGKGEFFGRCALPVLVGVLAAGCSASHLTTAAQTVTVAAPEQTPFPAIHNEYKRTVAVTIELNDSFDIYPDGHCAGRDLFAGISNAVPAQLKGATVGGITTTTATTHVHRLGNQYCAIEATFTPELLDPNGYLIKFSDRAWENGVTPDNDEWGTFHSNYQACQNRIAQPEEKCP